MPTGVYPRKRRPVSARFWEKVKQEPDGCWSWQGAVGPQGYGHFRWNRQGSREQLAHRIAYILTFGSIPDDQCVLHRCDNPGCCNPGHFFLGSRVDNNADMRAKGRQVVLYGDRNGSRRRPERRPRGEAHASSRLTAGLVLRIRAEHARGEGSLRELAKRYGFSKSAIADAISGRTWRHLP